MDIVLDISATLHQLVRRALESLPGARRGSLLVRDGPLRCYRAAVGFDAPPALPADPADDAMPASAALTFAVIPATAWYRAHLPAEVSKLPPGAGMIVVPVLVHGEPRGYLAVEQSSMELPEENTRTLLDLLAQSAGSALERRALYQEQARGAQEMRLLEDVLGTVASSVDLLSVISAVATGIKSTLPQPRWSAVGLAMVDEAAGALKIYRAPRRTITTYWNNVRDGALNAGRDRRIKVDFRPGTPEGEHAQAAILADGIRRRVQGIAIAPIDPVALEDGIRRATEAGIPVVAIDTKPVPGSRALLYIGTDNVAAGRLTGELMARLLPDGGPVAVHMSWHDTVNSTERLQGFCEATADRAITVLPPEETLYDVDLSDKLALAALARRPDLAGALGLCSENGPSWAAAAKASGRGGDLKLVAFDMTTATASMLKEGVIHATVAQREYAMGNLAVQVLHRMATEGVEPTLAALPSSRFLDTGVDLVTLERTPWSIALADHLNQETSRRIAHRKASADAIPAPDGELLVIGMAARAEPLFEERAPFRPDSLIGRVVSSGQSHIVDPAAPEVQGLADVEAARREGVRTMVGVPMLAHGAVLGVLMLSSEEAGGLGPEELALVERIASTAAIAIENARLIGEITERTRALEREARQQEALLRTIAELGSPVVPIAPGVLVMPLVGAMDAARAGRFIEAMLRELKARRARVLLIDVTGMAMADAVAVHHLTQAARAASLLGAEVVLVGIDPRSAQLMVEQGADVGEVVIRSNLELGFAYALSRTGGRIIHGR